MEQAILDRHHHELTILHQLLPACWKAVIVLQDLALRFSHPGWKDLFIRSWQQQSHGLTELEEKIWDLGGETGHTTYEHNAISMDPEEEPGDPLSLNRILLLRSINHLTHLMHVYGEVRRTSLPFDVRMVLQRHQLRIREVLEHLSSLYVTYPLRQGAQAQPVMELAF